MRQLFPTVLKNHLLEQVVAALNVAMPDAMITIRAHHMSNSVTTALRELVSSNPYKHAQVTHVCTVEELALSVGPELSIQHLEHLANALQEVRATLGSRASVGLCFCIQYTLENVSSRVIRRGHPIMQLLTISFTSWELWSGDFTYPVPGSRGEHARAYNLADLNGSMYTGTYGLHRKQLLDHLIVWTESLIERVRNIESMEPTIRFEVI